MEKWIVNINGVDRYGKTALIHAVESNEPQWVKHILSIEGIKPQLELSEADGTRVNYYVDNLA